MTDLTKLACKHVQELEPYQSARRIGGHGHTFLQKLLVGIDLQIEQVRDGERNFDFAELLRKLTHYFTSRMAVVRPCAGNVT